MITINEFRQTFPSNRGIIRLILNDPRYTAQHYGISLQHAVMLRDFARNNVGELFPQLSAS
jgi:hypothetical protein